MSPVQLNPVRLKELPQILAALKIAMLQNCIQITHRNVALNHRVIKI